MTSTIHYKVKSGLNSSSDWKTIHFNGIHLPLLDLKKRIIYNENWCRSESDASFDLQVTNSQNAEEFRNDTYGIHRNVSVIVKKIPAMSLASAKRLYVAPGSLGDDWNKSTSTWQPPALYAAAQAAAAANPQVTPNLARSGSSEGGVGGEEGDMSSALSAASKFASVRTSRFAQGPFQHAPSSRQLTASSKPPANYVCNRCKQPGHYIQFCPTNGDHNYDIQRRSATTREDRERERLEREKTQSALGSDKDYSQYTSTGGHGGGGGGGYGGVRQINPGAEKNLVWLKPVEDPKALSDASSAPAAAAASNQKGPAKFVYASGFFAATNAPTGSAALPPSANGAVPPPSTLTYQFSDPASNTPAGPAVQPRELTVSLRPDLACGICGDYFTDAQVVGCCFTSYCNECIREHFKKDPACPSCNNTDVTVDDLTPNVNLQKAVDLFLSENSTIIRGAVKEARAAIEREKRERANQAEEAKQLLQEMPPLPPAPTSVPALNTLPPPPPPTAAHYPNPAANAANASENKQPEPTHQQSGVNKLTSYDSENGYQANKQQQQYQPQQQGMYNPQQMAMMQQMQMAQYNPYMMQQMQMQQMQQMQQYAMAQQQQQQQQQSTQQQPQHDSKRSYQPSRADDERDNKRQRFSDQSQ